MFAILVAAKYTTDANVRAGLYTYRSYSLKEAQDMLQAFDYGKEAASPPNVVCPCSQYQTSLSEFMTYSFVNPSKAYSQDLPLCQIDRSYGPLSDAPQKNPGQNGVDFIVARVRVRETGAAAPGARTAAPPFPVSPAWVRQAVYLDNSGFTS